MKAPRIERQAEPAAITSLTFEPAAGSNLARAMDQAQMLAAEFQGAAVVFRHGALEVTVKAGGAL